MLTNSDKKLIQSLKSQHGRKKNRCFLVEGPKLVEELLSSSLQIKYLLATSNWISAQNPKSIQTDILNQSELDKYSLFAQANMVIAVAFYPKPNEEELDTNKYILALDTIQDPGNFGTILRTADWFGINELICSKETVDCYNPKVVQASMGSVFRARIHYVDLPDFISKYKGQLPVYGASMQGKPMPKTPFGGRGFIIIGNESKGISEPLEMLLDHKIHISKARNSITESLNASVACGIILNHLHNQSLKI